MFAQVNATWTQGLGDLSTQSNMNFAGGGSFTTNGATQDRNSFDLGAGLVAHIGDYKSLFADYTTTLSENSSDHLFRVGFNSQLYISIGVSGSD